MPLTRRPYAALALAAPCLACAPSTAATPAAATPAATTTAAAAAGSAASTPVSVTCGPRPPRRAAPRRKAGSGPTVQHVQHQPPTPSPSPSRLSLWQWPALPVASERCAGPIDGQALRDDQCELRRNATLLWNMGQRPAAVALLCGLPDMRAALEHAGASCAVVDGVSSEPGAGSRPSQPTR